MRLLILLLPCFVLACGPVPHAPPGTDPAPGPALQTAPWVNPQGDAIWSTSWVSAGDARFPSETPYDGDFYITATGHLSTDRTQALMSQPPLNGVPWSLTATIYEPLASGQVLTVTFVRCEPDGSFCAPVASGWQSGLTDTTQTDTWPHCTQAMKLSGGCFELQGAEGVAARLKYTPKVRIATLAKPWRQASLSVGLSMRAMSM